MYWSYVRRLFHSFSFSSKGESLSLVGSGMATFLREVGDAELVVCEVATMPKTTAAITTSAPVKIAVSLLFEVMIPAFPNRCHVRKGLTQFPLSRTRPRGGEKPRSSFHLETQLIACTWQITRDLFECMINRAWLAQSERDDCSWCRLQSQFAGLFGFT
jgi:hypothetical protein